MIASFRPLWRQGRGVLVAVGLSVTACTATVNADAGNAPSSFSPLVKKVLPAVVNIAVTETVSPGEALAQLPPELRGTPFERQFRDRFRNRREMSGAGSGFIIDPTGIIVTNNHVVGHADRISVAMADGTEMPATVVGIDDLTDIAVIKVRPNGSLPFVSWGDLRQLEVGDWILAAGNPFGLGGSVTAGIVSARGRDIGAGPFDDFIQLDAPMNPGNSGGPTFNMEGQVIGVNTAIVSPTGGSVGIGFAIPSEIASKITSELREKGHIDRGWLGANVSDLSGPAHDEGGVAITSVDRSGPAYRAGLRPGDIVEAVNGEKVDSTRSLIKSIAVLAPGSTAHLTIRRLGHEADVDVQVGRRPIEQQG